MPIRTISVRDAKTLMDTAPGDVVLLDCREPEELAIAKVPGSVDIPMQTVPARVGELDPAKDVLVICHTGFRSQRVATFLARAGFARVASVAGGIDAWSVEIDPSIPRY